MSRRTRKTRLDGTPFRGLKTRFRKTPRPTHGPIRRIVGDTPLKSLKDATAEDDRAEAIARYVLFEMTAAQFEALVADVERLKAKGWTKDDFALALEIVGARRKSCSS